MKEATGKYIKVRAITREEAINLTKEIFNMGAEICKLYAEEDKLYAKGYKLYIKRYKLYAERDKLYAEIAIKYNAYIPDYRAINLIAKDLPNHVYCFVLNKKELWIYNGENCPDKNTVEKVNF